MHADPHLREAPDSARREDLERLAAQSALRQPSRPIVTIHGIHRALDDLAPVRRGVDDIAAARVDAYVGYGTVRTSFLEEDQISGQEIRLLYALSHIPLPDRVIRHRHPLAEDQAGKAGAVLRLVSRARHRR